METVAIADRVILCVVSLGIRFREQTHFLDISLPIRGCVFSLAISARLFTPNSRLAISLDDL